MRLRSVDKRESIKIHKIETEKADASIAIGYGVVDATAATTGQISSIAFPDNKEDIYLSWIGAGLGIGVVGGLTILFNHEQILLVYLKVGIIIDNIWRKTFIEREPDKYMEWTLDLTTL